MDVIIVLGWDEMEAVDVLKKLHVIPTDESDPLDFVCCDAGIMHINECLRRINAERETTLEWKRYSGDHFVLIWRPELQKTIGDPLEPPVSKFRIITTTGNRLNRLKDDFNLTTDPEMICLVDAEVYYHAHIYDAEHSEAEYGDPDLIDDHDSYFNPTYAEGIPWTKKE